MNAPDTDVAGEGIPIRSGTERAFSALMFLHFFLVITVFWVLKPLKKGLFVSFYDETGFDLLGVSFAAAEAELLAKVLNMGVAIGAVAVFSALSDRVKRAGLSIVVLLAFVMGFALFANVLARPTPPSVWTFYLFGDLFASLAVAAFFAFLNDSVSADQAKRLYGPVGLGGVLGGAFGSTTVGALIGALELTQWLWVCVAGGFLTMVVAWFAGRLGDRLCEQPDRGGESDVEASGSAFEGARLVFRSRYLLSVAAIVGIYEVVSTLLDFQFTSAVAHHLDGDAIAAHMARVFSFTNGVSAFVQLFITPFIMRRFGIGTALLVLPIMIFGGSAAFVALPGLWVGSALNTVDNAFSYSVNQSAKEALYVPRSKEEKYKAKAFIDVFVQRFAKVLAIGVSLAVGMAFESFESLRWLSLFVFSMLFVWVVAARHVGRRFRSLEESANS